MKPIIRKKEKLNVVMGLDISTTTIGVNLITKNRKLAYQNAINLKKQKGYWDKLSVFKSVMGEIELLGHDISKIYVEAPLFQYGPKTNIKTIVSLQVFNYLIQNYLLERGYEIELINIGTARANLGLNKLQGMKNNTSQVKKHIICKYMIKNYNLKVEWTKPEGGKIKSHYYDISDSMVISLAGLLMEEKTNNDNNRADTERYR